MTKATSRLCQWALLPVSIFSLLEGHALAQTYYWNGGTGNWNANNAWYLSTPTNTVTIPTSNGSDQANVTAANATANITQTNLVGSLNVGSTDEITISGGAGLTVSSGTTSNSGEIQVNVGSGLVLYGPLSGGGVVDLVGGGVLIGSTLTNVNNTIEGGTTATNTPTINASTLVNESGGTVNANVAGQTLSDFGQVQNSGLLEASNFGTLLLNYGSLYDTNGTIEAQGGSTVNVNESASLFGTTVTAVNGGTVILNRGGNITNGFLGTYGSGKIETGTATSFTLANTSVINDGSFVVADGSTLSVTGSITNGGNIAISSTNTATYDTQLSLSGNVTLSGGGTVTLTNGAYLNSYGSGTLTNVDNTIQGGGLSNVTNPSGSVAIINEASGTIDANVTGQTFWASGFGPLQNSGILEASNGGILNLNHSYLQSTAGTILAQANSSVVLYNSNLNSTNVEAENGATVYLGNYLYMTGGTILTTGSGVVETGSFASAYLTNVTNEGNFLVADTSTLSLTGSITNSGNISISSTSTATFDTQLAISGSVTLSGGGTVTLTNGAFVGGEGSLTNVNNTIQGGGLTGNSYQSNQGQLVSLTNEANGTINANVTGQTFWLNAGQLQNSGTLEATNGGRLDLAYSEIQGTGGTIVAQANSSVILGPANLNATTVEAQNAATVYLGGNFSMTGGTILTTGSGVVETGSFTSASLNGVTNDGNFAVAESSTLSLTGSITNTGNIAVNSTNTFTYDTQLAISGSTTLAGGGTVTLTNGAYLGSSGFGSGTLTNVDNTIQGGGLASSSFQSNPGFLNTLNNETNGTIDANVTGQTFGIGVGLLQNFGTLEATNGGRLNLAYSDVQGTGGTILAQANSSVILGQANLNSTTVQAQNAGTVYLGGNFSMTGGTILTSGTGVVETGPFTSASLNGVTNDGNFAVADSSTLSLSGSITNTGNIAVNSTNTFTYDTQLAVSGNAALSGGGTVTLTNGAYLGSSGFGSGTLTNVNNTILGGGLLNTQFNSPPGYLNSLINESAGTIEADATGQTFWISANVQNTGTLEATNGGVLGLFEGVTSTGGAIIAQANSAVVLGQSSNLTLTTVQAQNAATVYLGGNFSMTGGTILATGSGVVETGSFTSASLNGVTNDGNFAVADSSTLSLSGTITNTGNIAVNSTNTFTYDTQLAVSGNATLSGGGTVTLTNGAYLSSTAFGSGTLTNVNNTIQGGGPKGVPFVPGYVNTINNQASGTINGNVAGQRLTLGFGQLQNYGTLEATNYGGLYLAGTVLNQGTISATSGAEVYVQNGVSNNAGVINVTGGTFDNGGNALANSGQILGYGTFNTGGLTNSGTISLTGGISTVNGNVTNNAGALLSVTENTANFTGNVTNNGTFRSMSSVAQFTGTFTNNGTLITDPSTLTFDDLVIGATGTITGGTGDVFILTGNLTNNNTNSQVNVAKATLEFQGTGTHTITGSGQVDIGTLELDSGVALAFNLTTGSSVYVGSFDLANGETISDITDNGGTIYYDPSQNSSFGDETFQLGNGGVLEPGVLVVPEPSTWALFLAGAGTLACHGLRRKRWGWFSFLPEASCPLKSVFRDDGDGKRG